MFYRASGVSGTRLRRTRTRGAGHRLHEFIDEALALASATMEQYLPMGRAAPPLCLFYGGSVAAVGNMGLSLRTRMVRA